MDKMIERLLPCPFCGDEAQMQPWHGGGPDKQFVDCSNTHCSVGPQTTGETPAEAVAAWNTRNTSQAETIDRLERRVECIAECIEDGSYFAALTYARAALNPEAVSAKQDAK